MPVEVNHASQVIFQDYHFRNKVVSVVATPEEKKKKNQRRQGEVKAFTSYTKKMTKSILRTIVLVQFIHFISDYVLVGLVNNQYLQSRTMSSLVYS
jgi:tRNA U34 5-methylaminomethyl-2-thiouridine-forming methyltransferase MnmC